MYYFWLLQPRGKDKPQSIPSINQHVIIGLSLYDVALPWMLNTSALSLVHHTSIDFTILLPKTTCTKLWNYVGVGNMEFKGGDVGSCTMLRRGVNLML